MLEIAGGEQYECPYCGADQQHMQGDDLDPESWSRAVTCLVCNRHWEERASVVEIAIPDEFEEAYNKRHPKRSLPQMMNSAFTKQFNPAPKPEKGKKK